MCDEKVLAEIQIYVQKKTFKRGIDWRTVCSVDDHHLYLISLDSARDLSYDTCLRLMAVNLANRLFSKLYGERKLLNNISKQVFLRNMHLAHAVKVKRFVRKGHIS